MINRVWGFTIGLAILLVATTNASALPIAGFGDPLSDPALTGGVQEGFDTVTTGLYPAITLGNVTYTGIDAPVTIGPDYNGSFNTTGGKSMFNDFDNVPTAFRFDFSPAVNAFAFNWGAADSIWLLEAFDSGNTLLDSVSLTPDGPSNAGEYFGLSAAGISYATLTDTGAGDFVFIDRFTTHPIVCGDGITTPPEQCDDGNTMNGDCCSSTCQYETVGSPCTDGNPCTVDRCDGAGTCLTQMPTGCKAAGKSLLLLKNSADDTKDKLTWKWLKGAATTFTELGVPTGTTNYALCVYAGTAVATVNLPAGSKWQAAGSTGFKFKDPTGIPDGAQKASLKSGAAGKSKALVKGKGTNLPDDLVGPLTLPVTAQLVNEVNNVCFESVFHSGDVIKNDAANFKAKH